MTILKTSEVLAKAKALIVDPENWMQGDYTDGNKCFCSLGALAVALEEEEFNIDGTAPARLRPECARNRANQVSARRLQHFRAFCDTK